MRALHPTAALPSGHWKATLASLLEQPIHPTLCPSMLRLGTVTPRWFQHPTELCGWSHGLLLLQGL